MRAEMLSPTFNPHLENFLHRQDGYIISKKKLSTAPIACREDSRIKFSLLNCHDLTQLPSAFSFPVLTGFFLALYANMKIYRRAPGRAILQLFKRFLLSPFTLCCQARRASPLQRGAQAYGSVLKHKGTVAILSVIAQVKRNYMTTELFRVQKSLEAVVSNLLLKQFLLGQVAQGIVKLRAGTSKDGCCTYLSGPLVQYLNSLLVIFFSF